MLKYGESNFILKNNNIYYYVSIFYNYDVLCCYKDDKIISDDIYMYKIQE